MLIIIIIIIIIIILIIIIRLRRYTKRSEQYKQNKMFREDSKRFYRELGKKTIQIEKPPDIGEVKKVLAEHTEAGGQTQ